MKSWSQRYRCFSDRRFIFSFILSLVLIFVGLALNYFSGVYATERASNPVTDVILSNIPIFDVGTIFVYATFIFWIFVIGLLIYRPSTIPFILKSIVLFIIVRSVFISLTHIGHFPDLTNLTSTTIFPHFLFGLFGGGLFFSGHTGLPFLLALLFWNDKKLRNIFMASSIIFAVLVLLGHLHYSIDVLGAFFITYTIAVIARKLFNEDHQLFLQG